MHLTQIKENYPLIAHVTLVDIKHLIYDNEVLTGMDSSVYLTVTHRSQGKNQYYLLSHYTRLEWVDKII